MKTFATPQWESNPTADKICGELLKKSNPSPHQQRKKKNKNKKPKIKSGRVEKAKLKKHKEKPKENIKSIKNATSTKKHASSTFNKNGSKSVPGEKSKLHKDHLKNPKKRGKFKNEIAHNKDAKHLQFDDDENHKTKKQKNKLTHQTLFTGASRKFRSKLHNGIKPSKHMQRDNNGTDQFTIGSKKKRKKLNEKLEISQSQIETSSIIAQNKMQKQTQRYSEKLKTKLEQKRPYLTGPNRKEIANLPLRERMMEKLKAARFRYLNEQMYTSTGKDAQTYFSSDPDAFTAYHKGYQQQVTRWPLNPVDVIIEKIKKMPQSHVIADFGCGEAKLTQSVPHKVHSFDLVAVNEHVIACDMAHVPLENNSVDVAVFCLSLMGTNLKDYLMEANRVLKSSGILKIAEVESRFENVDAFIKNVQSFGFAKTGKDLSHDLFCFLDFVKRDSSVKQRNKLPDISLNPCLYKKR